MNQEQLKNILEAALMVAEDPQSINTLLSLFEKDLEKPERSDIRAALAQLQFDYAERGVELKEVASGFRFQVRVEYAQWVNRLYDDRPQRYSRALLETLAIIAYRQPVTRGEIENIRGVSVSSNIIKTLQEREWIKVVGHRDVPGRPELLATTKHFLDYFNLKKLSDLPSLGEIKDFDQINPDLFDSLPTDPDPGGSESQEAESAPATQTENPEDVEPAVTDRQEESAVTAEQEPDDNVVPFSG